MGQNYTMVAKTLFGLEDVLAEELHQLGALKIVKGVRNVQFEGDDGFMYKANLGLSTAIRILKPIYSFEVRDENDFYKKIYKFNWAGVMSANDTLSINATVHSDRFTHSHYIALKCKDAIVDRFRDDGGKRPNVDTENPTIALQVHIAQHVVTVSLDTSGDSLHLRGYRTQTNEAPINEVLAAGLLRLAGWQGQCDLLDPMCGSGTLLIEAAMMACKIPPNIHRKSFGFQRWSTYDEALFDKIRDVLLSKTREFHHTLQGFDISMASVRKAQQNIQNAGLEEYIQIRLQNFFKSKKEKESPLMLVFNPPYDERISVQTEQFYKQIGDTLKQHYPGTKAWMITGNLEALNFVGLRTSRKIKLYNGNLEARLVMYEMYEGTRKMKHQSEDK
ncbi:MAG: THUMP domain-containing class I SAM-dependent RNA methyltransferase [Chitinophagaceae bacterium]